MQDLGPQHTYAVVWGTSRVDLSIATGAARGSVLARRYSPRQTSVGGGAPVAPPGLTACPTIFMKQLLQLAFSLQLRCKVEAALANPERPSAIQRSILYFSGSHCRCLKLYLLLSLPSFTLPQKKTFFYLFCFRLYIALNIHTSWQASHCLNLDGTSNLQQKPLNLYGPRIMVIMMFLLYERKMMLTHMLMVRIDIQLYL